MGIPKIQIGVITKIDHPQADAERAASLLKNVMMRGPIVKTSALEKRGIEFIAPLIELNDTAAIKQFVLDSASPYLEYCEP